MQVTADEKADPHEVRVVCLDDPRERSLIAGRGPFDHAGH
jgi:hypothetical protein